MQNQCSLENPSSSYRENVDIKGAQFIVQSNLKILARAIGALSKLAEDMYIDISDSGLILKSYNNSKSSFCLFRFSNGFFNDCDLSLINPNITNVCRMYMKSAVSIFKGVHHGDKNFVACEFRIDPRADVMMVKMTLNHDVIKTIKVKLLELPDTLLRPIHDRNKCRNVTVVCASLILPILSQMKNDVEVTICAEENQIKLRNYNSSDVGSAAPNMTQLRGPKKVRSETSISADKLIKHKVAFPIEITFTLREFLAVITFADQLGSDVCMYYDIPGNPVIVTIESPTSFEVELLLATTGNEEDFEVDGGLVFEQQICNQNVTKSSRQAARENKKMHNKTKNKKPEYRAEFARIDKIPEYEIPMKEKPKKPRKDVNDGVMMVDENERQAMGIGNMDSNKSWREREIVFREDTTRQIDAMDVEEEEEQEELNPEPMEDDNLVEAAEIEQNEVEQQEKEVSTIGLNLELDSSESHLISKTPPPAEEPTKNVFGNTICSQRKRSHHGEEVKRNKTLRRIMMGTRRREDDKNDVGWRKSQRMAEKEMLVAETQH